MLQDSRQIAASTPEERHFALRTNLALILVPAQAHGGPHTVPGIGNIDGEIK